MTCRKVYCVIVSFFTLRESDVACGMWYVAMLLLQCGNVAREQDIYPQGLDWMTGIRRVQSRRRLSKQEDRYCIGKTWRQYVEITVSIPMSKLASTGLAPGLGPAKSTSLGLATGRWIQVAWNTRGTWLEIWHSNRAEVRDVDSLDGRDYST